jgi:hypothetical protein
MLHLLVFTFPILSLMPIQSFASNFEFLVICLLLFLLCFIFYCFTLSFSHFTLFCLLCSCFFAWHWCSMCYYSMLCNPSFDFTHCWNFDGSHLSNIFTISVLHSMHMKIWVFSLCFLCVFLAFQFASSMLHFSPLLMWVERNME